MKAYDLIAVARRELGTYEQGGSDNRVKFNNWFYDRDVQGGEYPWCMAFVQWCFNAAGEQLPFKTASCASLLDWWRKNRPASVHSTPMPGDIVIFSGHTGIVEKVSGATFWTIEGNYGNRVAEVKRSVREALAFLRPAYEPPEPSYDFADEVPAWGREAVNKALENGILAGPDGSLGLSRDLVRVLVFMERAGAL